MDGASRKPEVCSYVEKHLKNLRMLLDLLVSHGEGILSEFLDAHRTVRISDINLWGLFQ